MYNVLIIEDSSERIEQFKKNFTGARLIIKTSVQSTIDYLKQNPLIHFVFLDHDLGNSGTVMDVLKWAQKNYKLSQYFKSQRTFIHSANPVGIKNIQKMLPYAHLAPMVWKTPIKFNNEYEY